MKLSNWSGNARYRLRWLFLRPWQFWCGLFSTGLAWPIASYNNVDVVLAYGFALQILGLYIAAKAINSNERLFAAPRLRERIKKWWSERSNRPITLHAESARGMAFGTMHIVSRKSRVAGAPQNQDIDDLWFNFTELAKEVGDLNNGISKKLATLEAMIANEKIERAARVSRIEETMKMVAVSSPITAYFGIFLAIIGSAQTTFASFIVSIAA